MHWPKVRPRTATPVETATTSVMPGIAFDRGQVLHRRRTVPLIVGGRQTMVGSAPGTSRSIANFLRPVTTSRASIRLRGVPMTVNFDAVLERDRDTATVVVLAAFTASSP